MSVRKTKVSPEMRAKYAPRPKVSAPVPKAIAPDKRLVQLTRQVLAQLAMPGAIPSQVVLAALVEARGFK